jgi:Xaa-Pro aminopeptidase
MKKVKELQNLMKKAKIDALLLINPNIYYLTKMDLEYSFLVIPKDKPPIFLVSGLEYTRAKRYSRIKVKQYKKPLEECAKIIGKNKNIGINTRYLTIATYKAIKKQTKECKYKPGEKLLEKIRITKTKEEIKALQEAAAIGDKIFNTLTKTLKEQRHLFKTEIDIAHFIEEQAKVHNTTPSFDTIVASGKNASLPHYHPQRMKIQKGFCVLDFGVRHKHYISDMSRTIFFGTPTEKERETYKKVLKSNMNAIAKLKIGTTCKSIDKISRREFTYPHSLGHGIGTEVHEAPSLSPRSKNKIEENMCFTIEPGIYVPNKFGIRIEDDIWMKKRGPIILTKSTKELLSFPL